MKRKNLTQTEELNFSADDSLMTLRVFPNQDYPVHTHYFQMSLLSMQMIRWHWHEEMEIIIVEKGTALLKTEATTIELNAGQGIFLNSNLLHAINGKDNEDCALFSLRFHPRFLFGTIRDSISEKYLTPVLSNGEFRYLVLNNETPVSQELLQFGKQMIDLDLEKPAGYEMNVKGLLCQFWGRLVTNISALPTPPRQSMASTFDAHRIKTAIRYIEDHYSEGMALEGIADSIHLSKSECCRCFKRTLGITPFEYLLKYRIFISVRKMQRKDPVADTISDLAASVGFNSASYYNKVFRKYLHCTPLEYKRRILTSPDSMEDTSFLLLSPVNVK